MKREVTAGDAARILHRAVDSITAAEIEAASLPVGIRRLIYKAATDEAMTAAQCGKLIEAGLMDERGELTNEGERMVQAVSGY